MATTALSTLIPLVRVRKCPDNLVLQELRNAHREFCDRTEIWEEDLTTIDSVADQAEYALTSVHAGAYIKRVTLVTVDDADLYEAQWSVSNDNTLTLEAVPTEDDLEIVVKVIYLPSESLADGQDWIVERFGLPIAKGAEARLKEDPISNESPVPWFDQIGATVADGKFMDGVASAKADKMQYRKSGPLSPIYPDFYL
jgi:hypothetical protein